MSALRGFALRKARGEDVAAISRKGGKAAHDSGNAHEWTSDEAREAGAKGGLVTSKRRAKMEGTS